MKRKNKTKIKLGDVIEIPLDGKFAYAQIINYCREEGWFIRVFDGIYYSPLDIEYIETLKDIFQTFLLIDCEIGLRNIFIVGNFSVPKHHKCFPTFKTFTYWGNGKCSWYLIYLDKRIFPDGEWYDDRHKNLKYIGEVIPHEFYEYPTAKHITYFKLTEWIYSRSTNSYDVGLVDSYIKRDKLNAKKEETQISSSSLVQEETNRSDERKTIWKKNKNPLKKNLLQLLNRLDSIAENHSEVFDTEVREKISSIISCGFILMDNNCCLPDEVGMFSRLGNRRVLSAIREFVEKSCKLVQKNIELNNAENRLEAFQDMDVFSDNGNTYDVYFGHADIEQLFSERNYSTNNVLE